MRVLLTIHHFADPNAGAPGVTLRLAKALRELGHEAAVLSWDDMPSRLGPRARELLFAGFAAGRIRRAAHSGVDVVDASSGDAWLWGALRRRRSARGPALITRTHGLEHTYRDALRDYAARTGNPIPLRERLYHHRVKVAEGAASIRAADCVLALNSIDRDRLVDGLGVDAERVRVVPNGVPDEFLGLPAPVPLSAGEPVRIAQIGSWHPRKGADDAATALTALMRRRADVSATLLGTAAARETVHAAFPAELRERVTVIERYEHGELPVLLQGHSVLLLPSLAEGFSLALVEGMACGLAPVATRVGAAPDVIADGETGLLVAPVDPEAAERALERLCTDARLLHDLRCAAHAQAQQYSWRRVATDTAEIYAEVSARRAQDGD